ncbi:MAG: hypothetical protein K2X66_03580 [Cyanobacteria bacterium]|nr:hypothetical protein [Cyanobacteriota bacterium]
MTTFFQPDILLRSAYSPALSSGTVTCSAGSSTLSGSGTAFLSEYTPGDRIKLTGGDDLVIQSITDDFTLTTNTNATLSLGGVTHKRMGLIRYNCATPAYNSGGPLQTGPDIVEHTISARYLLNQNSVWKGATRNLGTVYTDASYNPWIAYPDSWDTILGSQLSTSEAGTKTTSATGLTVRPYKPEFMVDPMKTNIITVGDSITAGLGYGAQTSSKGDHTKTYQWQMLQYLKGYLGPVWDGGTSSSADVNPSATLYNGGVGSGYPYYYNNPSLSQRQRIYETHQFLINNIGQGSGSWENINSTGGPATWHYRWNKKIYQKVLTLPVPTAGQKPYIFLVWLGTNDCAYDSALSASTVWARAVSFINILRNVFSASQAKVIIGTSLRRKTTNQSTLDSLLDAYNQLIRANALSVGFDAIADIEKDAVDTSGTFKTSPYYPFRIGITNGPACDLTDFNSAQSFYWDANTSAVHPSGYGYNLISKVWAGQVNKFI